MLLGIGRSGVVASTVDELDCSVLEVGMSNKQKFARWLQNLYQVLIEASNYLSCHRAAGDTRHIHFNSEY